MGRLDRMVECIYKDMVDFIEGLDFVSQDELQNLLKGSVADKINVLQELDKTNVKQLESREELFNET